MSDYGYYDYDLPQCNRCNGRMGIPRRFGRGERACPFCNPGPIREWWWRNVGLRWMKLRWRFTYGRSGGRGNVDAGGRS